MKKLRKGVTRRELAPALKGKKRPRGRPFPKGHTIGAAFRYPKGVSGNPGGRTKCAEVSRAARAVLAASIPGDPESRTFAEGIAATLAWQALAGDRGAASELVDRAEGRARVAIDSEQPDPLAEMLTEMRRMSAERGKPEGMPENPDDEEPVVQ